ncbi:hypothetical protein [Mesoterricola silvestris]|uniref:Uncharacterized protein n=1 Tax=Mesoterricola silvestris TaxID=2927979 RepID=A0AA48HAD4_9BACT|nr:hypothetical protein [Mesoterricola silvestris]BDU74673.1 hypothetical protein METEAL_38470 [Mesoterricola silvestris]
MLILMIRDELAHLRRSPLIQAVLAAIALLVPAALLASVEHVQAMSNLAISGTAHLAALITGSVVTASLIADLQQGIPILFVVRPMPRAHFLLARGAGMTVVLLAALGLGVGCMLILNAVLVKAPLDPVAILRGLLLARLPGVLLAMACGLLVGVLTAAIPGGLALFLLLTNALIIALQIGAAKVGGWVGWGPATQDWLLAAMTVAAAAAMVLWASIQFSRRSI